MKIRCSHYISFRFPENDPRYAEVLAYYKARNGETWCKVDGELKQTNAGLLVTIGGMVFEITPKDHAFKYLSTYLIGADTWCNSPNPTIKARLLLVEIDYKSRTPRTSKKELELRWWRHSGSDVNGGITLRA